MDHELQIDWLRLIRSPGMGAATVGQLIRHLGTPEALLTATAKSLRTLPGLRSDTLRVLEGFRREIPAQPMARELERLQGLGGRMIMLGTPDYPELLAAIHDPPSALFVIGDATLLHQTTTIAITGTRTATPRGQMFALHLTQELTRAGVVTMSGLSAGIDAAVHRAALEIQGPTVAVLATGLDVCHPREHRELQQRIKGQGCLVSEAFLGLLPVPWAFPLRARVLTGLTRGVVIVEAPEKSGSLLTARLALDQGREVFAVPGLPNDPASRGTHGLLRQGARLVEGAQDILEELPWCRPVPLSVAEPLRSGAPPPEVTNEVAAVLTSIQAGMSQEDELARCCQLTVAALSRILLQLELSGLVARLPGGRYAATSRTGTGM
ncbi:MAG: DNA-protecting protein DprA [Magnetococcales bacterium]|nr:DNA-protecting protein DprA [Magnetococcales bacterium]